MITGYRAVAAISTPRGKGGIGTVRISGDGAIDIADSVFNCHSGESLKSIKGYTARYGRVSGKNGDIDDAVALVFRAPHSYTGEDTVEITVHGGDYVTSATLRALLDAGADLAGAGEFTKMAFLNGKMDLSEAESVMEIVSAEGERQLRAARAAADGAIARRLADIKAGLVFAAATVTAFTDFPDEEPSFSGIDKLPEMLSRAEDALCSMISNYDAGKVLREGVRTAIVGSTNVGKSTLMNLLTGEDRSIVTDIAGTTRDVVEETVRIGDVKLCLSDTAGIRDTDDAVERIGVERSKKAIDAAELIIFVTDAGRALTDDEEKLLGTLKDRKTVVVINKTDVAEPEDTKKFEGFPTVRMSAKNGTGLEMLQKQIEEVCGSAGLDGSEVTFTSERQRSSAEKALKEVRAAQIALAAGITVDAAGTCIDSAIEAINELTGESVTVEVADEVFRKFCVGK